MECEMLDVRLMMSESQAGILGHLAEPLNSDIINLTSYILHPSFSESCHVSSDRHPLGT